jgi:DNA-binding response OmpR family regulator
LAGAYLAPAMMDNFPGCNLSPSERVISDLLLSKLGQVVTKSAVMNALYFNKVEEAQPKIIDVFLFRLRKRLAGKFVIESVFGKGLRMVRAS